MLTNEEICNIIRAFRDECMGEYLENRILDLAHADNGDLIKETRLSTRWCTILELINRLADAQMDKGENNEVV